MTTTSTAATTLPLAVDPSSQSNCNEAHITHLFWDASIDFTNQLILARATYTVQLVHDNVKVVKLDTSHLDVHSVLVNDHPATFSLTVPDVKKLHLGSCLEIQLNNSTTNNNNTISVTIEYTTTHSCSAAQWLPPPQTAGKKYPYIFTQCQAIHARSLLPCMDCPSVKMTYEAKVEVPCWATAVMSALSKDDNTTATDDNNTDESKDGGTRVFHFYQPVPIPSYLFALAVGELSSIDISSRCRVWCEPSMVDAVAYEFNQVEQFLVVAEELTLEYQWRRYDILCLPPSFPYGGMENPCVSFLFLCCLYGHLFSVE